MEKEKVSIITAVYKTEPYLRKCIESILNQTYQNIELLLIDDGSPDNCPQICDEYASRDSRIKVIHQANGGVPCAWNTGLDNATGDYIAFVDSDDYVEPKYIEILYETLSKYDADIAICRHDIISGKLIGKGNSRVHWEPFYPAEKCLSAFLSENSCGTTSWSKLYKKSIFENLRYPENIQRVEDYYIICDLCRQIKKGIATTGAILYHYIIQPKSVSRTPDEKKFDSILSARHVVEQLTPGTREYNYAVRRLFYQHNAVYRIFKQYQCEDLLQRLDVWFKEDYAKYGKLLIGFYFEGRHPERQ